MINSYFKLVVFLILLLCATQVVAHKYFFSTSELTFDKSSSNLEFVLELTTHDLEYVLTRRYDKKINFDNQKDKQILKEYILSKIKLKYNAQLINFDYVGEEIDHKVSSIYLEAKINNFQPELLQITNQLFFDVYPNQINLVNANINDKITSLSFMKKTGFLNINSNLR